MSEQESASMNRWGCTICSYAYDPRLGDPDHGVEPGTPFAELSDDWHCPWCGASKSQFEEETER